MGSHREFLCLALMLHENMFLKHFSIYFNQHDKCADDSKYMVKPDWFSFRFLDILAARKDPAGLMGVVLIDGAPQPPNFKCLSGYVVQVCQTRSQRKSIRLAISVMS